MLSHDSTCFVARRDLANGCVVAEILARYYPQDVSLHSFENVSSLPLKDANWHLLLKLFKVRLLFILLQAVNTSGLPASGACRRPSSTSCTGMFEPVSCHPV